jgi:uncharacterized protein (TIGR02466 family)
MNDKILWPLFAKPIFKRPVDVSDIDLSSVKWAKNYNNWISESQNVLGQPEFAALAEKVYDGICEYFYGIMQAKNNIEIYITESWFNKTEKGQSHHRHWHPNSLYSGIVYIDSEGETGRTRFITSQFDTIEYGVAESNLYNSRSWNIDAQVGTMLVFPSSVEHLVEEYNGARPRITLSFNTFVRGDINTDPLTRLSL